MIDHDPRVEAALAAYHSAVYVCRPGGVVSDAVVERNCMSAALRAADAASPVVAVPEELRLLSDAATKGLWYDLDDVGLIGHRTIWSNVGRVQTYIADCDDGPRSEADGAFIVAAVNHVRSLLAVPSPPRQDGEPT